MNLLLLAVTSSLLVCNVWGGMTRTNFDKNIEKHCFPQQENPNEPPTNEHVVHGQMYPRSQTLENFIALAEKLEVTNPNIRLKEELFHFVRNYILEDIEFDKIGDAMPYKILGFESSKLETLWEPDFNERGKDEPFQNPFTQEEICSLFFLLSHSIIRTAVPVAVQRSATNDTIYMRRTTSRDQSYIKNETLFPMEIGVVSVKGLREAVALGKVLTGMYVGLRDDRKIDVLRDKPDFQIDTTDLDPNMDALYALTLADVIALAKWRNEYQNREGLADDGTWMSVILESEIENKDQCPIIYKLKQGDQSLESYSSLRGAADGFILGKVVKDIVKQSSEVKLSEILRMYYSKGGLSAKTEETTTLWASFCNRKENVAVFEAQLLKELKLYHILTAQNSKFLDDNVLKAWEYYLQEKSKGFGLWTQERDLCSKDLSVDQPENLPLESPLDIIAVIDTNYGIEFVRRQQEILGYMAKELELRYYGSRMTILWDKKLTSTDSAKSGRVTLKPLIEDTFSSACAACLVTQVLQDDRYETAPEDEVILAIDQLLQEKKDNETRAFGTKGKVVIYFNFKEDTKTSRVDPAEVREGKALRDMLIRHIDVAVFALGRSNDLIKKYARNSAPFILSAVDEAPEVVGKELFKRISKSPATIQYPDCDKASNENGAIYEDYVSRNARQHWQMPAKYFYKSRSLKFTFESMFGSVKVCHNRATVTTENVENNCKSGTKIVFEDSNPCKGFDEVSCSPYYFSVIGNNNTDEASSVCTDTTTENKCKTMDQIRFKVTHQGIRCSGSSGLLSTPLLLVLGVVLLQLLTKRQ